ncbi:hypothetical protein DI53_2873 [Sphingobacterium deserti]|uniref:Uncharacterized protein n=1 Tax=Sphingobacterium deserti TaxID=1229276 RepID=A0A0B8SZM5_9SPHI|nr:hypothetical protein DI53_2873 [Sphingobacterium deserti]
MQVLRNAKWHTILSKWDKRAFRSTKSEEFYDKEIGG